MRILTEQVDILAPHPVVWAALEDFGDVAAWAPYMHQSGLVGDQRTGVGTRREMQHSWGFRFEEVVTAWNDGYGFSFNVHRAPFPMTDVHESWLTSHDNGQSTVTTTVNYSMRLGILGRLLDWVLVRFVVKREMRAGLRGLKQYVENQARISAAIQYSD